MGDTRSVARFAERFQPINPLPGVSLAKPRLHPTGFMLSLALRGLQEIAHTEN